MPPQKLQNRNFLEIKNKHIPIVQEIKLKIFIYGGTGYLGSSLISGLGKEHDFYVTSRKKKRET